MRTVSPGARRSIEELLPLVSRCAPGARPLSDPAVGTDNFTKRDFARALRRSQLRRVRFHDLRHTHASLLIAQGAHPKYIPVQLGHASIQTTLDRYGHLMPKLHAGEALKLDRLVFGAAPVLGSAPGADAARQPS